MDKDDYEEGGTPCVWVNGLEGAVRRLWKPPFVEIPNSSVKKSTEQRQGNRGLLGTGTTVVERTGC